MLNMPGTARPLVILALVFGLAAFSSCSLNRMATRMTADALTSKEGAEVFSSDEDPELIADALPFGLKMYESLLATLPEHEGLLMASAEGFVSYAQGFIMLPAERLDYSEREEKKRMRSRAKKMFERGRDYALRLLDVRYPGFEEAVGREEFDAYLLKTGDEDVEALYWAAAGWMGAISAAGLDISMLMQLTKPVALMSRAFELDPGYDDGAIHTFLIELYGSVPSLSMLYGSSETGAYAKGVMDAYYEGALGRIPDSSEAAARHHLRRARDLSEGELAAPYIAFASSFSVKNQDAQEYKRLLEEALAVDPDVRPESRLVNILDRRRAEWMLEHIGDKFITYTK